MNTSNPCDLYPLQRSMGLGDPNKRRDLRETADRHASPSPGHRDDARSADQQATTDLPGAVPLTGRCVSRCRNLVQGCVELF